MSAHLLTAKDTSTFEDGYVTGYEDDYEDYEYYSDYDYKDYDDQDYDEPDFLGFGDISLKAPTGSSLKSSRQQQRGSSLRSPPTLAAVAHPPKNKNKNKSTQLILETPARPLQFPLEILENVCVFLSQATLRFNACLVCKSWNVVCSLFIRRVGVWKPLALDYQEELVQKLKWLNALECWFLVDVDVRKDLRSEISFMENRIAWEQFLEQALAPIAAEEDSQTAVAEGRIGSRREWWCLLHNIKEIALRNVEIQIGPVLDDLLPGLYFIHTMTIELERTTSMNLFPLLDGCPHLKKLTIQAHAYRIGRIQAGCDEDDLYEPPEEVEPAFVNPHWPVRPKPVVVVIPPVYEERYLLEELVLIRPVIRQRVFERILATCPELRILHARDINQTSFKDGVTTETPLDMAALYQKIREHCPKISSTVFITHYSNSGELEPHLALVKKTLFPDPPQSLTLRCSSSVRQPFPNAFEYYAFLTYLQVQPGNRGFHSATLNDILCRTPHLLHLIAPHCWLETRALNLEDSKPLDVEEVLNKPPTPFYICGQLSKHLKKKWKRDRRMASLRARQMASTIPASETHPPSSRGGPGETGSTAAVSKTWVCQNLQTLEISLTNTASKEDAFWYFVRHLPKLRHLRLGLDNFMVGQFSRAPHIPGPSTIVAGGHLIQKPKPLEKEAIFPAAPPSRHASSIQALRGLRHLESVRFQVTSVPGYLRADDFEFLKRFPECDMLHDVEDGHDCEYGYRQAGDLSALKSSSSSSTLSPSPSLGHPHGHRNQMSEQEQQRRREEMAMAMAQPVECTHWPKLESFTVRFQISKEIWSYREVIEGLEELRPGVEFQIKELYVK